VLAQAVDLLPKQVKKRDHPLIMMRLVMTTLTTISSCYCSKPDDIIQFNEDLAIAFPGVSQGSTRVGGGDWHFVMRK
jgi:hypothetical protein